VEKTVPPSRNIKDFFAQATCGAIVGFVIFASLIFLVGFTLFRLIKQEQAQGMNDSQEYLVSLSNFLGSEWETGNSHEERNEDLIGYHRSIVGHSSLNTHHKNNPLAYIRQQVIIYDTPLEASRRYTQQQNWIFIRDFGVPPTQQIFSYEELQLSNKNAFQADEYFIACLRTPIDTRCSGLFRYDNYIIFVDSYPVRDSIRYLTEDQLISIFDLIDDTAKSFRVTRE